MEQPTGLEHYRSKTCGVCHGKHLTDDDRLCYNCDGTGTVLVNMNPQPTTAGMNRLADDVID